MSAPIPTRFELKCAGCSFAIAHVLCIAIYVLHSIDYDHYSVENEDDVIELHNVLSSESHRIDIEIAAALAWIAFPMMLIGVYGFTKLLTAVMEGTSAMMVIYLFEKAYLMWILIMLIIMPALSLAEVSYDWSFHESTPEGVVPPGYYVQVFISLYQMEFLDSVCIADATLMICLFLDARILMWESIRGNYKLKQFRDIITWKVCKKCDCCLECFTTCMVITMFILFCIVLFQFAESGFMSTYGYAKYLAALVVIFKIMIGIRVFFIATFGDYYERISKLLESYRGKNLHPSPIVDQQKNVLTDTTANYKMETINVPTNDNNDDDNDL